MPTAEAPKELDYTHADLTLGQGSQVVGEGSDVVEQSKLAEAVWTRSDKLLVPLLGFSLRGLALEGKRGGVSLDPKVAEEMLKETQHAQPTVVINALMRRQGLIDIGQLALPGKGEPGVHIYNSVGGIAAAVIAGALTEVGGAILGDARGRAFEYAIKRNPETTMFAVLGVSDDQVEDLRQKYGLVNCLFNAIGQTVLGGEVSNKDGMDVTHALAYSEEQPHLRGRVKALNTAGAFHSKYFEDAVPMYKEGVIDAGIEDPKHGILVGGTTVRVLKTAEDVRQEFILQLTNPEKTRDVWPLIWGMGVRTITELTGQHRFMGSLRRQFGGDFDEVSTTPIRTAIFAYRWEAPVAEAQPAEVVVEAPQQEEVLSPEDAELYGKIRAWYINWLTDRTGIAPEKIQDNWQFAKELKMDSQDGGVLRSDLLDEFGKVVPIEEALKNDTVEKAVKATFGLVKS